MEAEFGYIAWCEKLGGKMTYVDVYLDANGCWRAMGDCKINTAPPIDEDIGN